MSQVNVATMLETFVSIVVPPLGTDLSWTSGRNSSSFAQPVKHESELKNDFDVRFPTDKQNKRKRYPVGVLGSVIRLQQ